MTWRQLVATAAACMLWTVAVHAQETRIRVTVLDAATDAPVRGVVVAADSAGKPLGTTDAQGIVSVRVERGATLLFLRRLGFAPASFALDSASLASGEVRVTVRAVGQQLQPVLVSATAVAPFSPRLRGFGERIASKQGGYFFTREDIRRRNTSRLLDLFRTIPSVQVAESAGVRLLVSRRLQKPNLTPNPMGKWDPTGSLKPCVLQVVIDGNPKEWGFPLDALEPSEVHGVEVYAGPATLPAEFNSLKRDGWCGAVLIWTRDR